MTRRQFRANIEWAKQLAGGMRGGVWSFETPHSKQGKGPLSMPCACCSLPRPFGNSLFVYHPNFILLQTTQPHYRIDSFHRSRNSSLELTDPLVSLIYKLSCQRIMASFWRDHLEGLAGQTQGVYAHTCQKLCLIRRTNRQGRD